MRRAVAVLLTAVLLFAAAGCSALFDREVYLEEPYEAPSEISESEDTADTISSYAALRRAITRIVAERAESAVLQFQNYEGTISRDLSTACWEVKSSTALGAFAVDYISYDLSRIVSYTQAEIHITYKRSEYQMSAMEKLANLTAMRTRLQEALRAGETYLVLELTTASLSADTVRQSLERAYYDDPMSCPVLPEAEVTLYPDTGVQRIIEMTLDYGMDSESLAARREEFSAALEELLAEALPEEDPDASEEPEPAPAEIADRVRSLCEALADTCVPDAEAGATAWDALVGRTASDEGMAMALEAACQAAGIECRIVFGRLDVEDHAWNIVTFGGGSYHVDVSRWDDEEGPVFLAGDEDLGRTYWWDTAEVPACPVRFGEAEASTELPSGEAAQP